jgi:A/G-specific adenine glycosylase
MENNFFADTLIQWFSSHARDLPWRKTKEPYHIWLSEVILQQTRVAQGLPYFLKFTETFPSVREMAAAEEREVLRLWQGLGYYSRARNMHATAQIVVQQYNGFFPDNYSNLLKLKGVGPYTAAAIASFAFEENVAVLDGNVFRVLARYWGIDEDIASYKGKKIFEELAKQCLPETQTATYNQAIMEFGALQCAPASPQCMFCPLNQSCVAFAQRKQEVLPVKIKKLKIKERFLHYIVVKVGGENLLMRERKGKGIWQGLYEFLCLEASELLSEEEVAAQLQTLVGKVHFSATPQATHKHVLTHQHLYVRFWEIEVAEISAALQEQGYQSYTAAQVHELPKPILIANYLDNKL